jgi:nucleotide-binding universal stress UspA family protein
MGSRGHSGLKGVLFGSMTNAVLAGCAKPLLVLRGKTVPPQRDSLDVGIAVDGSGYGLAAVRWVIKHRALFGAEPRVELIHVHEDNLPELRPRHGLAYSAVPPFVEVGDADLPAAAFDKAMTAASKRMAKAGLDAKPVRLRAWAAGDAIAAYVRQRRLDVIVMGSHGHGAFKSLVLGSVAMRVAARCDTPLLLVREPLRARG